MGTEPREMADIFADMVCIFGSQKFPEALNQGQWETAAQTIDRRLEEIIGTRLQLPPIILTGFLYVMDANMQQVDDTHL